MAYKKDVFKSVSNYQGKIISRYKDQIEIQNKLLIIIASSLPEHLSSHALFCVISSKKIILYTDSATWSSQLRFYTKKLLQVVRASDYGNYEEVKIKIIPKIMEREDQQSIEIPSAENINFIFNQAENHTDEKLKKALLKLATTFNKLSKKRNEVSF